MRYPKILEVEKKDLPMLNKISMAAKMYWEYPNEWIALWIEDLIVIEKELEEQQFLKICDENGIAGFSVLEENENNFEINQFNYLWIKPEAKAKGYGKKLLNFIIEKVVYQEKPLIVVSDSNAEAFYRKFGITIIDRLESKSRGRLLPVMIYKK